MPLMVNRSDEESNQSGAVFAALKMSIEPCARVKLKSHSVRADWKAALLTGLRVRTAEVGPKKWIVVCVSKSVAS